MVDEPGAMDQNLRHWNKLILEAKKRESKIEQKKAGDVTRALGYILSRLDEICKTKMDTKFKIWKI